MSEVEKKFHKTWLGMAQPVEGLVVSVPVLVDAQCMQRHPPEVQTRLVELCPPTKEGAAGPEGHTVGDLGRFFEQLLELTPDLFDTGEALPEELALYVAEGRQTLQPTMGLKKLDASEAEDTDAAEATPASKAGAKYVALVWDLEGAAKAADNAGAGIGLGLDKPETVTGSWDYPPAAKFDRLLRHTRVPIGVLTNRETLRLVYAPHGESSGHLTFRFDDLATVGGRPLLDALIMLLSATRFFGVAEEHALPALLSESRKRQANVTNELAEQVFEAQQILLAGFEAAAERDGRDLLDDALTRENDHLYKGLLTVLLRLVFLLYAEDRGLLPTEHRLYAQHLSMLGLFERLQEDAGANPDSMARRFGAWGQVISLFRAVFLGIEHGDLRMPPRRGALFDPNTYPFLEGWGPAGGAPIVMAEHRAEVRVPTLDDETVFRVLEKLIVFEGQRLSYRTLDVEQIGSVYEALMGYHVVRTSTAAVCMKPDGVWLTVEEVREQPPARQSKWLKDEIGLSKAQAAALAAALKKADCDADALEALGEYAKGSRKADKALARAKAGQLVLQPGAERRRTSSHYTPRSLSAPIVQRTIEPLLACMGKEPPSDQILELKICDPAMGSGAFLVEACRFLADHLVAAWTREGKLEVIAGDHEDPVLHARRLVAQRCLYGVDKNDAAVELAKLSLWLVTLAKDLPFTFIDHALRHGDSLVGLSFDQIKAFHWKPDKQVHLAEQVLKDALDEAISIRQEILALAGDGSAEAQREKKRLLDDAEDACDRARLLGDVVVGAFFAEQKDPARAKERLRRLEVVERWLAGDEEAKFELRGMQAEIRARLPVFHWMLEYPEVFYAERPDPLDEGRVNRAAHMDGFVGNPPFVGGTRISTHYGLEYRDWLAEAYEASSNTDMCAFFFVRCFALLGEHGCLGMIATSTIAEGDTRKYSLTRIRRSGGVIFDATTRLLWPGTAAVSVCIVHVAKGRIEIRARLDGRGVERITAFLSSVGGDEDPVRLSANRGIAYYGSKVSGIGFVFDDGNSDANPTSEMRRLIEKDERNNERVYGYVGGEDINSMPDRRPSRFVIDFGEMSEAEARGWPDLFGIVERRVKPARAKVTQRDRRELWWLHVNRSPQQRAYVAEHRRCLALSQLSTHLALEFIGADVVVSHTAIVVLFRTHSHFAILQSRTHSAWATHLSSSLKNDLRYTPSSTFDTFPFPNPNAQSVLPTLETIGARLYDARATHMVDTCQGLTQTYNLLKDPDCHDEPIVELRRLHEEIDRAVLDAYGWSDVEAPPYCPATPAEEKASEAFQEEVIDRLFVLNAERAEEERALGLGTKTRRGKKKGLKKKATSNNSGQASLSFDD